MQSATFGALENTRRLLKDLVGWSGPDTDQLEDRVSKELKTLEILANLTKSVGTLNGRVDRRTKRLDSQQDRVKVLEEKVSSLPLLFCKSVKADVQVASLEGKVQGLNAFCEVLQQGSCNCEARSVVASGKSEEYLPMTPVDKAEDGPYVEVGGTSAIPRIKPPVRS